MKSLNTNITLNIEFKDPEFLSNLNNLSLELSISLDDFVILALDRLLRDIYFIRNLRNFNQKHSDM